MLSTISSVLFGRTVLDLESGNQTTLSKFVLQRIYRKGRVGNQDNTEEMAVQAVGNNYGDFQIQVVGLIPFFTARNPILE